MLQSTDELNREHLMEEPGWKVILGIGGRDQVYKSRRGCNESKSKK